MDTERQIEHSNGSVERDLGYISSWYPTELTTIWDPKSQTPRSTVVDDTSFLPNPALDFYGGGPTTEAHGMGVFSEPSRIRSSSREIAHQGMSKTCGCTAPSSFTSTACSISTHSPSCAEKTTLGPTIPYLDHMSRSPTDGKEGRRKRSSRPLQRQKPLRSAPKPAVPQKLLSPDDAITTAQAGHASGDEGDQKVLFACPFWRKDPSQNMDCMNLRLTRSRDVKQHLQRRHYQSLLSCPICQKDFSSNVDFSEHAVARRCVLSRPVPGSPSQRVPLEVQEELKKSPSRTLSQEEQWYAIWNLLFPNVQQPRTPYLDTVLGEGIGIVQRFWDREGINFSARFLEKNRSSQTSARDLNLLVTELLGHLQQQLRSSTGEAGQDRDMPLLELKAFDTPDSNSSMSSTSSPELKMSSSMVGEMGPPEPYIMGDTMDMWPCKPLSPCLVVHDPDEMEILDPFDYEQGWQGLAPFPTFTCAETGGRC